MSLGFSVIRKQGGCFGIKARIRDENPKPSHLFARLGSFQLATDRRLFPFRLNDNDSSSKPPKWVVANDRGDCHQRVLPAV